MSIRKVFVREKGEYHSLLRMILPEMVLGTIIGFVILWHKVFHAGFGYVNIENLGILAIPYVGGMRVDYRKIFATPLR